jgi:hypothetical protein
MTLLLLKSVLFFLVLGVVMVVEGGDVTDSVKLDKSCVGGKLVEIRVTDCESFPCTVKRGRNYTVDAEFSLERSIEKAVVRCGTIYLGRQYSLPGHGGCETVTNGSCPLQANTVYNTFTSFVIPYYVPPVSFLK